jgi:acid stress-induced BolA-like protein IbaG/YrbA
VPLQIHAPAGETTARIEAAIRNALPGCEVEARGAGGHFEIRVVSAAFEGRSRLQRQRLVYQAIAPLMQGPDAPVHAVDRLETATP